MIKERGLCPTSDLRCHWPHSEARDERGGIQLEQELEPVDQERGKRPEAAGRYHHKIGVGAIAMAGGAGPSGWATSRC